MPENASLTRLDDQINWYDRRSRSSQVGFKALKIITIAIAALITINPLFVPSQQAARVSAVLGALVLLCEGIQQLNQYQANWISYRSTCESLKHEKFLFLALSGHLRLNRESAKPTGRENRVTGFTGTCKMGLCAGTET